MTEFLTDKPLANPIAMATQTEVIGFSLKDGTPVTVSRMELGSDVVLFDPPYLLSSDRSYAVRHLGEVIQIWEVDIAPGDPQWGHDATKYEWVREAPRADP